MRKILFLFLIILVLIFGGLTGVKIIKEKLERKFIDPAQNFFEKTANEQLVASISGVTVIFPRVKDYTELFKTLQTVLNGATMGMKIKTIDLRFEKPVVNYGS